MTPVCGPKTVPRCSSPIRQGPGTRRNDVHLETGQGLGGQPWQGDCDCDGTRRGKAAEGCWENSIRTSPATPEGAGPGQAPREVASPVHQGPIRRGCREYRAAPPAPCCCPRRCPKPLPIRCAILMVDTCLHHWDVSAGCLPPTPHLPPPHVGSRPPLPPQPPATDPVLCRTRPASTLLLRFRSAGVRSQCPLEAGHPAVCRSGAARAAPMSLLSEAGSFYSLQGLELIFFLPSSNSLIS